MGSPATYGSGSPDPRQPAASGLGGVRRGSRRLTGWACPESGGWPAVLCPPSPTGRAIGCVFAIGSTPTKRPTTPPSWPTSDAGMTDLERRAPRWAATAILALGIWGMLIGEPYWRAVGHGPTALTWSTCTALVLSAPASLFAPPAARIITADIERDLELVFVLEHIFWAILIILQWLVLFYGAARLPPARKLTLFAAALSGMSLVARAISWTAGGPIVPGGSIRRNRLDPPIGIVGPALAPPASLLLPGRV